MRKIHPTLINHTEIVNFYGFTNTIDPSLFLSQHGVIHTRRTICPDCGTLCSYNGSNNSGHLITRSYGSIFKIGQQRCSSCNKTYQVENEFIHSVKTSLDQFVRDICVSLREKYLSYSDISDHFKEVFHISISSSSVQAIVCNRLASFEELEIKYEIENEFYGYDEQYLKVNGKRVYRIVIYDYKNMCPIYEEEHETLTKKLLKSILNKVFADKIPKGFVFDMRTMYPKAFREVFGKKIKLQFCVFHLHKHILDEYKKALKLGDSVKFTLMDYRNMYALFDVFYDRTKEINLIEGFQKELEQFKQILQKTDMVEIYAKGIKFPKKCDSKKEFLLDIYEKSLMKKLRRFLAQEKLKRRREKRTLVVRDTHEAEIQLKNIVKVIDRYPKKVQKIIKKMSEEFDLFTGSEGEIPTNNKLEGFFGTTLKKFRKKGFQTKEGLQNFFTFKKAKYLGQKIVQGSNLCEISTILGIIPLFKT
jgi:transposase-like protein